MNNSEFEPKQHDTFAQAIPKLLMIMLASAGLVAALSYLDILQYGIGQFIGLIGIFAIGLWVDSIRTR